MFCALQSCSWKQVTHAYNALIDRTKSALRKWSGEIDEMSQSAKEVGIRDGYREAQILGNFRSYEWFDEYLPQEERFIANCNTSFCICTKRGLIWSENKLPSGLRI
uniref:Uncharacterized protein n=1 Tax=Trieres chinensis TaxID=1514140 RepID=A0A7S1ZJW3_TRICV|mmetsp:Transcript_2696/g.5783  ORF Transcript_2696/g.5783 Transcript_2696/m.5783 type:complete len:106 (+) Transcript_2696:474-791(+)